MASDKSGHSEREFYIPRVSFFQFENRNFWKEKFIKKKLRKLFTGLPQSVCQKNWALGLDYSFLAQTLVPKEWITYTYIDHCCCGCIVNIKTKNNSNSLVF